MLKLEIKKSDLEKYLEPFSYKEILVFSQTLLGEDGFFGIKNNALFFISTENIEEDLIIEYPAEIQEVQAFVTTADYLIQRVMASRKLNVIGFSKDISEEKLKIEILKIFYDFIENYNQNTYLLEKIKHNDL